MLDFLLDKNFVMFGGLVFQQTNSIPLGTNCAPFTPISSFTRMKLNSYRGFCREKRKGWLNPLVSRSDDRIYPIELEIKDTTETEKCASYQDVLL